MYFQLCNLYSSVGMKQWSGIYITKNERNKKNTSVDV